MWRLLIALLSQVYDKAYAQVEIKEGIHPLSQFLTAPRLTNSKPQWTKYPVTPDTANKPSLFSDQILASELEETNLQLAAMKDYSPFMEHRFKEITTICSASTTKIAPPAHEAIDKAVNARISVRKEAITHLNDDLKPAILMIDPFPTDAMKDAMGTHTSIGSISHSTF